MELVEHEGEALGLLDALGALGDGSSAGVGLAEVDEATAPREPVDVKELVGAMRELRQRILSVRLAALWLARRAQWP